MTGFISWALKRLGRLWERVIGTVPDLSGDLVVLPAPNEEDKPGDPAHPWACPPRPETTRPATPAAPVVSGRRPWCRWCCGPCECQGGAR